MKTPSNNHYRLLMPLAFISMLFLAAMNFGAQAQSSQVTQSIITALQEGNSGNLSNHFNNTIDLKLPGYDAPCSKKQAGQILKRFFEDHPVKQFKSEHQGTSHDGSFYMIGALKTTDNKSFRVYVLIKKRDGIDLIQQLQFDED